MKCPHAAEIQKLRDELRQEIEMTDNLELEFQELKARLERPRWWQFWRR